VESTHRSRRTFLLIAAGLVVLAAGALAVGFATGYVRVGWVPALEVRRDRGVEELFPGREAVYAYRFRGGVPKCWAYVERPTGPEARSLDAKPAVVQGPTPRTPPNEVEGLIALVGPPGGEKGEYSLHLVISKLEFPEGRRPFGAAPNTGATYWTVPTPDAPKPPGAAGSTHPPLPYLKSPDLQPGQDIELVNGPPTARSEGIRVRLWIRFYAPNELATAEAKPGGGD
jgi:hypothetical protein